MIPITLLTGFLGAGKTTLLNHILKAHHGKRIFVIQNEFSTEMGIEKALLLDETQPFVPDIRELPNGCLCCSVRDEMVSVLEAAIKSRPNQFDYVIIEASGVTDPQSLIRTFWLDEDLLSVLYLDGVVALVDAVHCDKYLKKADFPDLKENVVHLNQLREQHTAPSKDEILEMIAGLAIQQVVCSNTVLLTKTDLVDKPQIGVCQDLISQINPTAQLITCVHGIVDLELILNQRAFSPMQSALFDPVASSVLPRHTCLGSLSNCFISWKQAIPIPGLKAHQQDSLSVCKAKASSWTEALWAEDTLNTRIGELAWTQTCGQVYRYKGLTYCYNESEPEAFVFALQGVGEVFSVDALKPLTQSLWDTLINEQAVQVNDNELVLTHKLLFIGMNLDQNALERFLRSPEDSQST